MRTAVDSSVLLAIFNDEPGGQSWLDVLMQARREGPLVICDVVYAEVAAAFLTEADLQEALRKLGATFDSLSPSASWRAGMTFRSYRDTGGPREHLIPDFLIAAHALAHADRLAAVDRGYLRQYFADLALLQP
jgi:predicted nucleic acid-binding protein